jgi:hypothetical protein
VVVLLRLGDRREPLPQILRAGRGMQLAGIRLPGRNLGPHHVAFALGVGPGLEVVYGAEQVITLAPSMRYHRLRRAVANALKVVMVEPYRTGRPLGKN